MEFICCLLSNKYGVKVKQSHYRPVPRGMENPDFKTISTLWWQGCQPFTPAAFFPPRKYSCCSFLLETESTTIQCRDKKKNHSWNDTHKYLTPENYCLPNCISVLKPSPVKNQIYLAVWKWNKQTIPQIIQRSQNSQMYKWMMTDHNHPPDVFVREMVSW